MRIALTLIACALLAGCGHPAPEAPAPEAPGFSAPSFAGPPLVAFTPRPHPTWTAEQRAAVARSMSSIFGDDILVNDSGIAVVAEDGTTLHGMAEYLDQVYDGELAGLRI